MKESTTLKISNLKTDLANMKEDTARKEIADRMVEDLSKDIYLEEAFFVMEDLLKK